MFLRCKGKKNSQAELSIFFSRYVYISIYYNYEYMSSTTYIYRGVPDAQNTYIMNRIRIYRCMRIHNEMSRCNCVNSSRRMIAIYRDMNTSGTKQDDTSLVSSRVWGLMLAHSAKQTCYNTGNRINVIIEKNTSTESQTKNINQSFTRI